MLIFSAGIQAGCIARFDPSSESFTCQGGERLSIIRAHDKATVIYNDATFILAKQPSNLGERFSSDAGTLIIDGDFAAFVTPEFSDLNDCRSGDSSSG